MVCFVLCTPRIVSDLSVHTLGAFRLGLTSVPCTEDAMLFICAEAFRRCSIVEIGGSPVPLPQPTCRRRCDQFVDRCSDEVLSIGSSIDVQCDAVNPVTQSPVFPSSATVLNLPNGVVVGQTFSLSLSLHRVKLISHRAGPTSM